MKSFCQRCLAAAVATWLLVLAGYGAPAAPPKAATAEEKAAEARVKASEALADSLLPRVPGRVAVGDQSDPNNGASTADPAAPNEADPAAPDAAANPTAPAKPKPAPSANLFRIPGPLAVVQARAAGYHFSPAGGSGWRNGIHTIAQQHPNTITSEIDGVALRQFRSPPGWAIPTIANTFYMFVQRDLTPAPLAPGWKIRGIHLKGTNWKWVDGPQSGAPSASFAIAISAGKFGPLANEVILEGLSLEGPPGETDWRKAFAPASVAQR